MGSGPRVARLYQRLLAINFAIAFVSLGMQVRALMGSRGLLPAQPFVASLEGIGFFDAPTLFRLGASDRALVAGVAVGVALSIVALLGIAPRVCFAALVPLYLGYVVVGRTFFGFQWDNLLLESGFLALFLSGRAKRKSGRGPGFAALIFLVLLWKLYAESGVAKWQSPLGDWQDGSAMTYYYETAPLPTRLAWYAHALPAWWHHVESWFTLGFELLVPFAAFGPRRARVSAFAVLTAFQIVNFATANYGFFVPLALALHVFLLDESDVRRLHARAILLARRARARAPTVVGAAHTPVRFVGRIRRRLDATWDSARRRIGARASPAVARRARRALAAAVVTAYVGLSAVEGLGHFAGVTSLLTALAPVRAIYEPLRIVNNYHLFGAITRERIEPELETLDGTTWIEHAFHHKPGPVDRAPDRIAPHQPRLDFQLWFYGLGYRRGMPIYVATLLDRLCRDPDAVQSFFIDALPPNPVAVRISFWRYVFTTPSERRETGAWWRRERIGTTRPLACTGAPDPGSGPERRN